MKRIFAISAAALLASCDTLGSPPSGPYYPPAGYPPQPYPPGGPYSPAGPYAPVAPVEACPVTSSRNWRAWVTREPGPPARSLLNVTGTVVTPTGGYRVEFVPELEVIRSYPVQMVARLLPIPPEGPATQAQVNHAVRWQWPLAGPVGTVAVRCGDRTLANITATGSN